MMLNDQSILLSQASEGEFCLFSDYREGGDRRALRLKITLSSLKESVKTVEVQPSWRFSRRHVDTLQPKRSENHREKALKDEKPSKGATSDSGRSLFSTY